ncbi:MAG: hypothetical protein RR207_06260, partial [Clostridia bacterium]
LIVVIVIIAILAGVLIPTFGMVIERAHKSNDTADAVDMTNKLRENDQFLTRNLEVDEVINYLTANHSYTLQTRSKNTSFWYDRTTKSIVLKDTDEMLTGKSALLPNSQIVYAQTAYTQDKVEAISATHPECLYIDQKVNAITSAVAGIRNLGKANDLTATFTATVTNNADLAKYAALTTYLNGFNPATTMYVTEDSYNTKATQGSAVTKIVFSTNMSYLAKPELTNEMKTIMQDLTIKIELPQTIKFIETGALSWVTTEIAKNIVVQNKDVVCQSGSLPATGIDLGVSVSQTPVNVKKLIAGTDFTITSTGITFTNTVENLGKIVITKRLGNYYDIRIFNEQGMLIANALNVTY